MAVMGTVTVADLGQSSVYVIIDTWTGKILKYGKTNNPITRYSTSDFDEWKRAYGGQYEMQILKNFDSEEDALAAERYMTERWGGKANEEAWARTVQPTNTWEEDLRIALNLRFMT